MTFEEAIRKNRFHGYTVRLPPDAPRSVCVRQVSHAFSFGSNIFGLVRNGAELDRYRETISALWNFGTLPFYWGRYEPEEGKPEARGVLDAARWAVDRGFTTKGHPLCWHTVCADWLLKYDNDTILGKQLDRIRRDVSLYAGLIDMWDVINEVVIMPRFDRYDNAVTRICNHIGPVELTLRCFRAAREANPRATLLINDFLLSPEYEQLIERLLDRGCPIDAIGLQTHQHTGYHGVEYTLGVIERFGRFGKPLHFTEATILSGAPVPREVQDLNDYKVAVWPSTPEGEQLQGEQVGEYYSAIYSRPEVQALVWWDIRDGAWLGAPAGLVRRDYTPKPAFQRLEQLIKGEWWFHETELGADGHGCVHFTGPAGRYEIVRGALREQVDLSASAPTAAL